MCVYLRTKFQVSSIIQNESLKSPPRLGLNKWAKMQNIMVAENSYMYPYNLYMTVICNKKAQKVQFQTPPPRAIFFALEIKKLVLAGKIL